MYRWYIEDFLFRKSKEIAFFMDDGVLFYSVMSIVWLIG